MDMRKFSTATSTTTPHAPIFNSKFRRCSAFVVCLTNYCNRFIKDTKYPSKVSQLQSCRKRRRVITISAKRQDMIWDDAARVEISPPPQYVYRTEVH